MWVKTVLVLGMVARVSAHGALVSPRSRNSIDYLVGVNTARCSNLTGDKCENGQASFWCVVAWLRGICSCGLNLSRPRYSQGCFIGCPTCDNMSGRRQVSNPRPSPLRIEVPLTGSNLSQLTTIAGSRSICATAESSKP